jgi:hypothetical protein
MSDVTTGSIPSSSVGYGGLQYRHHDLEQSIVWIFLIPRLKIPTEPFELNGLFYSLGVEFVTSPYLSLQTVGSLRALVSMLREHRPGFSQDFIPGYHRNSNVAFLLTMMMNNAAPP